MALVLIATPAAVNANSFETLAEAQAYFEGRLPLAGWDDADSQAVLLVMATRTLEASFLPGKRLVQAGDASYYVTRHQWTGTPSTTTQRLSWPRTGMYDRNGNLIPSGEIPYELKDAISELAGQLGGGDRTLDNDVIVQGITSLRAGSVSLSFKDSIAPQVIPDAVINMLPPSWYTDEIITSVYSAEFEVI
jgi:hypothetical protein